MKTVTKIVALLLVLAMAFSLAACHPKGEVAVSSGDFEITSAMYSYYLVMADMEAQNKIGEDESIDTTAKDFDYYKQKIDGKPYEDYVKDLALQHCLKAIAYQQLCADKKLELSSDDIANAEYMAQYNWYYYGYNYGYQYGYADFLPLNGVNFDTYTNVTKINYYGDVYFKHLYDKGGEKEIAAADIDKAFDENYVGAYIIAENYTEETQKTVKEKLTKYIDRLKNGEEFKTIYDEHNDTGEDKKEEDKKDETSSDASSSNTSSTDNKDESTDKKDETSDNKEETDKKEEETPKAKDELISVLGSKETESNYTFAKFDEVKAMAKDEIKLIEDTDSKAFYLVVKKDLKEDTYYKQDLLASDLLYLLKGDEFTKTIEDYVAKMEYDVSNFAINQFKVKKINYGA